MGNRWRAWALAFCFLVTIAHAQDDPEAEFRLRFRIYPPDAKVYRVVETSQGGLEYLGPATGLNLKAKYAQRPCSFVFQRWGFHFDKAYGWDRSLPIREATGSYFDYFPINDQPPIEGQPNNPLIAILTYAMFHPKTLIGPLFLLGVGALLWSRRRGEIAQRRAWSQRRESLLVQHPAGDPLVGASLGRYLVLERLGEGLGSIVYKAVPEDTLDLNDAVAIKMMRPEVSNQPDFLRRFRHEVQISADLKHPFILRVDDWGEHEGIHYMVQEYIAGQTLETKIPPSGLPLEEAMLYLDPILQALIHAHRRGVVHRDLRPVKVMIAHNGARKVMDFGLSSSTSTTVPADNVGNLFVAPELSSGEPARPSSDQYAFGLLAGWVLTGNLPGQAHSPASSSSSEEALSNELKAWLIRLTKADPRDRFVSLEDARERLLEISSGSPWGIRSPDPTPATPVAAFAAKSSKAAKKKGKGKGKRGRP